MDVRADRRPAPDAELLDSALRALDPRPERPGPPRRSALRATAFLIALFAIPAALLFVPTGDWILEPGPTPDVRTWIRLDGKPVGTTPGRLLVTTVYADSAHLRDRVRMMVNSTLQTVSIDRTKADEARVRRKACADMARSASAAVVAASTVLGRDIDATVSSGEIDGPSAGLMIAIGIVDVVGGHDFTRGRIIAGTGTIDPSGRVGPVGGIDFKVAAAERAGANVFLAPAEEADEARDAARHMRVVAVADLRAALRALRA